MELNDETLMAYADGELPPEEAARVAAAIAADPALATRARVFGQTRRAMAGLKPAPVPDALADRIRAMSAQPAPEPANVIPLRRRITNWQLPAAAAIALAIGLGAGATLRSPEGFGTVDTLAMVLETVPSGESASAAGGTFAAVSTFRDGAGDLCREFEFDRDDRRITSVACSADGAWQMRFASGGSGADGYAPVSSLDALEAWFGAVEASPPLDPQAEAEALSGL